MERFKLILTYIMTLCAFIILMMLLFKTIPDSNRDVFNTIIGVVIGGGLMAAYQYFYGDSDKKD